ncbi:alpha/beta fold hydrolase [Clavibacter sepedonicus]|uniref:Secreted lactone hydrolase n=1 Tax=Clavibacter sepedonicus TaxID=31964 RepID=B0RFW3_CLASE|nr:MULTISPECIES: alpha/beta hydrolase [Clavibacter]MBD5380323.1 alpha/beta fold hydrolase [Clavibacter sp.]OQJ46862.1 alpha/beta hydrolase [Clavibacter sepedonicus]OQJ55048.1 alpha/beta hydrolase [Clavibacter sepedonicus]UUK64694.1 alpha/beta hydrolase [Clavibacter sepedonicus]CAQ01100.1 putative secreted lactone hydrolase [Clavibacter sepedonicus]
MSSVLLPPVLVGVPCFSGAPWEFAPLTALAAHPTRTFRLPDDAATVDEAADALEDAVADLPRYVLVGDSFGAVVSLALALRQPPGLAGPVLFGGFAADPTPAWKTRAAAIARHVPRVVYEQGVLRFHTAQLASPLDAAAPHPLTRRDYRELFLVNTPAAAYSARVGAVVGFDVRARLHRIDVPTLLLTPEDDRLVGPAAAAALRDGLPHARELVIPGTGHMLRFTHPERYADAVDAFVRAEVGTGVGVAAGTA